MKRLFFDYYEFFEEMKKRGYIISFSCCIIVSLLHHCLVMPWTLSVWLKTVR